MVRRPSLLIVNPATSPAGAEGFHSDLENIADYYPLRLRIRPVLYFDIALKRMPAHMVAKKPEQCPVMCNEHT